MTAAAAFRTDRLPAWNRRVAELLGALAVRAVATAARPRSSAAS